MRLLGIDFGRSSIRAVELESAFGKYEINDHYEQLIHPGEEVITSLATLIHSLPKIPDKIAVALHGDQSIFRNLVLPTKDRKALKAGVGFELEDEIPFDIADTVYHYSVLNQHAEGGNIHVAASLRENVELLIDNLNEVGVDPEIVTTSTWAYHTLFRKIRETAGGPSSFTVLDLGYETSMIYSEANGIPIVSKTIRWGGRHITEAISQRYRLSFEDAEKAKLDAGFVLSSAHKENANTDQIEFSETIYGPIKKLFQELKQANLTFKKYTETFPEQIYIAGGTSLLPGLKPAIQDEAHIPVDHIQTLGALSKSDVNYSMSTEATFGLAAGLALTLTTQERSRVINLRTNDLAKGAGLKSINWAGLKRPLTSIAIVLVCIFASTIIQTSIYESRLETLNRQLEKSIKNYFGGLSRSKVRSYMSNPEKLRRSLERENKKKAELGSIKKPNPHSTVKFLEHLSKVIPKSTVVDMVDFTVGSSASGGYDSLSKTTTQLRFLVDTPKVAAELKKQLTPVIDGIKSAPPKKTKSLDGKTEQWEVTFTGTPKESAYGN